MGSQSPKLRSGIYATHPQSVNSWDLVKSRRTALHAAARNGDKDKVDHLVSTRPDLIDVTSISGKTALFYAAREGHQDVVATLLSGGANPHIYEEYGKTPLQIAAQNGFRYAVDALLRAYADPDAQDDFGKTALHFAAESGHEGVVLSLLTKGASTDIKSDEGKLARDSASDRVKEIFDSSQLQDELQHEHPGQSWTPDKDLRLDPPRTPQAEQKIAMEKFQAIVTYYDEKISRRRHSVHRLIYEDLLKTENVDFGERKPALRWFHLPQNNIVWVRDLARRLCHVEGREISEYKAIQTLIDGQSQSSVVQAYGRQPHLKCMSNRVTMTIPYIDTESRECLTSNVTKTNEMLKGAYPNATEDLHFPQTLDQFFFSGVPDADTRFRDGDQVLAKAMSLNKVSKAWSLMNQTPQPRRSQTSPTTVPWKPRTLDDLQQAADNAMPPMQMMVSQAWLWQIDERTVITCFPDRSFNDENSTGRTLFNTIKDSLKDLVDQSSLGSPVTPALFIKTFGLQCMSFFGGVDNSGLEMPASWWFARYIATQNNMEVQCRRQFEELLSRDNRGHKAREIHREVTCLREIKDVRDEINMIQSVLRKQRSVLEQLEAEFPLDLLQDGTDSSSGTAAGSMRRSESGSSDWLRISASPMIQMSKLQDEWRDLDDEAERVEKSLYRLLDFKQKQASLDASDSASQQVIVVLIFTVVTVIFSPLSFIAGLYELDIFKPRSGTQAGEDGGSAQPYAPVLWDQTDIGKALGVGELITLVVIFLVCLLFISTNWAKLWKRMGKTLGLHS